MATIYYQEFRNIINQLTKKELLKISKEANSKGIINFKYVLNDYSITELRSILNRQIYYEYLIPLESVQTILNKIINGIKNTDVSENVDQTQIIIEIHNELDKFIGLEDVKAQVKELINYLIISKEKEKRGLNVGNISLHMVFYGNPGTGKTSIARIMSKIYYALDYLKKNTVVEVDREKLISAYLGQTAIKTKQQCEKALDGVLFIDEAYTLSQGGKEDYGNESIGTLVKFMEDKRDRIAIIVAGYPEKMREFFELNEGLKSRFNRHIFFKDYSIEELVLIFKEMCKEKEINLTEPANKSLDELFKELYSKRDDNFGNGRLVRNVLEKSLQKQANRLAPKISKPSTTDQDLLTLIDTDIPSFKEMETI